MRYLLLVPESPNGPSIVHERYSTETEEMYLRFVLSLYHPITITREWDNAIVYARPEVSGVE